VLQDVARLKKPLLTTFFGNPYVTTFVPELPAMLLTFDLYDLAVASAVRAIAGEIPIRGKLPIVLPGVAAMGFGLERGGPAR
jgi:beta-N-acetylhexosaminidase